MSHQNDSITNNNSFHGLFCYGYEERGCASAGVLAIGPSADVNAAMHVVYNAAQLATTVAIYTNVSPSLFNAISTAAFKKPKKFKVDDRKIVKFEKSSHKADVILHFEDGTRATEGSLAHRPYTEVNGPFAQQLGCEVTELGDLKTMSFLNESSVHGVFAAGDCATPLKAFVNVMNLGGLAAAGLAGQLEMEMTE